jgi:hypothetical protein
MAAVDLDTFMDFVHKFAGDLGAAVAAGNVVIGDRLGLYRALATGAGDRAGREPRRSADSPNWAPSPRPGGAGWRLIPLSSPEPG